MATITATCVTQRLRANSATDDRPSGIDKGAVAELVATPLGVEGDKVLDTVHHGGRDKALYAYADEDAAWWADRLDMELPPGRFGENLRTSGIDINNLVLGTTLRIGGTVEIEVSEPRVPCGTFKHHMDDRTGWVKEFTLQNRTGTYLRVNVGGTVRAGDEIEVLDVPDHGIGVARWFGDSNADDARALLAAADAGWDMPAALRASVENVLAG